MIFHHSFIMFNSKTGRMEEWRYVNINRKLYTYDEEYLKSITGWFPL